MSLLGNPRLGALAARAMQRGQGSASVTNRQMNAGSAPTASATAVAYPLGQR